MATTKPLPRNYQPPLATTKPLPSPAWPLPSHYQAPFGDRQSTTKHPFATTKPLPSPLSPLPSPLWPLPSKYQAVFGHCQATTKRPSRVRVLGGDVRRTSRLLAAGHSKSWRWCWFCLSFLSLCALIAVYRLSHQRMHGPQTQAARRPAIENVQSGCH